MPFAPSQYSDEFISFFKKLKSGDKTARIPKYKDKVKGRNKLSYPKNAISTKELRNGYIKLTGINTKELCINKLYNYFV